MYSPSRMAPAHFCVQFLHSMRACSTAWLQHISPVSLHHMHGWLPAPRQVAQVCGCKFWEGHRNQSVLGAKTPWSGSLAGGTTLATFQVSSRCSDARRSRSGSLYCANSDSQLEPAGCGLPLAKPRTATSLRPCLCCPQGWYGARGATGSMRVPLFPHSLSSMTGPAPGVLPKSLDKIPFNTLQHSRLSNVALRCQC